MSRRRPSAGSPKTLQMLAPLPWRTDLSIEPGVVFDAAGAAVIVVDQHNERPDRDVHVIADAVVAAMNATVRQGG